MAENDLAELLLRLDVLVALQLRANDPDGSMAARIRMLKEMGFSPTEIARVVKKPLNYVTANLNPRKKT